MAKISNNRTKLPAKLNSKTPPKVVVGGRKDGAKKLSKIHLLIFALIMGAIGSYFLWRSFAAPTFLPAVFGKNTSYSIGVLVVKYFPLTSNGQNIDSNVTGDVGDLYSVVKQNTINYTNNITADLPKASSYLASVYPGDAPSLNYHVVATHEYDIPVPIKPVTNRPTYPDYNGMMMKENICNYVDGQGVSEVWLWAYQGPNKPGTNYPYLGIDESKMSGPYGDISNSYRYNDMPKCQHTYRVYTFNYGRGTAEAVHSWGHQIEAELNAVDPHLFALFQGPAHPQATSQTGRCGSVHNPPNARFEYDWANSTPQNTDCLNWNPDGLGTLTSISCSAWGCNFNSDTDNPQLNWQIWMWQHLPGMNNTKAYQGNQLRNWWDVHGNFDSVMSSSKTLALVQPMLIQSNHLNVNVAGSVQSYQVGTGSGSNLWYSPMLLKTGGWGTWNSLRYPGSGVTAQYTTELGLDGLQRVAMTDSSGTIWINKAPANDGTGWSGWSSLGAPSGTNFTGGYSPMMGQNADGRLEIYGVGANHTLYHRWELSPNGSWSGWSSLASPSGINIQGIGLTNNKDGRLEVFMTGTDGKLWHNYQVKPSSGWSGWSTLGNPGTLLGSIALGRNLDGRLEVFANGSNGLLYHLYQVAPNSGWGTWSQLSGQSGFIFNKFTNSGQGPMVGSNADGRLELYELGTNGALYHNYQLKPNSGWVGWTNFGLPSGVQPKTLTNDRDTLGYITLAMSGTDGNMWYRSQAVINGGWNSWQKVAPPNGVTF